MLHLQDVAVGRGARQQGGVPSNKYLVCWILCSIYKHALVFAMTDLVRPPLSEHFRIILRSLKGSRFSLRECRKSWFLRCFSSLSPVFLISMMWIMVAPMLVAVGVLVNKLKGSKDRSGI